MTMKRNIITYYLWYLAINVAGVGAIPRLLSDGQEVTRLPVPVPIYVEPPVAIDTHFAIDPLRPEHGCPDVMCMMYCENGFEVDDNGCNMCSCLTPMPSIIRPMPLEREQLDCCVSCGYSYCKTLDICVRPWETYCSDFDVVVNPFLKTGH